ncbi:hypothetical protein JL722_3574 [Aureococcus anophagefferens]|nr:hypothetical protein JL722_3574 [Aureococcus anophagefferens]
MLRDRLPVLLAACIAALCLATFIRFDASSPEQPEAAAHPAPPPTTAAPPERRDAMPAFYDDGSGAPIVDGLERCAAFRAASSDARRPAVAGLFDAGTNQGSKESEIPNFKGSYLGRTNLLAKLLRANCVLPRECAGVATRGAPGHADASAVEAEIALFAAFHGTRKGDRLLAGCAPFLPQVLPVVVAKDPLAWVGSVCREPYALRFASGACAAVGDVAAPWPAGPRTYASLFDLWAAWHGEYLDAATPRLLVRYEDLLWRGEATVAAICACVGGDMTPTFDAVAASAKDGGRGHADKARTSRGDALRRYGNATLRRAGLSEADLAALARLPDARLLRRFAYDRGYR